MCYPSSQANICFLLSNLILFNLKSLTLEETTEGKLLMLNKNKNGHNTVPCDTPETKSIRLNCLP